jgi:hypothetical protein
VKVLDYVEGARARAVRAAPKGRYDRLDRVRLVLDVERDHLRILELDRRGDPGVNALGPAARRRFVLSHPARAGAAGGVFSAIYMSHETSPSTVWTAVMERLNAPPKLEGRSVCETVEVLV